jgi:hypothetical protein
MRTCLFEENVRTCRRCKVDKGHARDLQEAAQQNGQAVPCVSNSQTVICSTEHGIFPSHEHIFLNPPNPKSSSDTRQSEFVTSSALQF